MVDEHSIVICGLPESGKTTFLAALWHLVMARDVETALSFESLRDGDVTYLNKIAKEWRDAKVQERTDVGAPTIVTMNLRHGGKPVRLTFPDLNGEAYQRMWEDRECDEHVARILADRSALLLFVHADKIVRPQWLGDLMQLAKTLGLPAEEGKPVPWHPLFAPTQVQLVELIQFLFAAPLDAGSRKLAVVLSAWDKVAPEGRTPSQFLGESMPLLWQLLRHSEVDLNWKVFGVSAQGGDFEPREGSPVRWSREAVAALREIDQPSKRIQLVTDDGLTSHDLTTPLAWLMK